MGYSFKDEKGIAVVNTFQKILNDSKGKPDKTWVGKGRQFCNGSMKFWLGKYRNIFNT